MPVIKTKGAGSAQGFGEFTQSGPKVYIEDVFSTWLYTGNNAVSQINNGLPLGSNTATSGGGIVLIPSNIYIGSTAPSTFGTGDFTIECFFYNPAYNATSGQFILDCYTGPADGDNAWGLSLGTTGLLITSTYNTVLSTSASPVSLNTWHHVAWARSGSSNAVWLDGVRVNSYTNSFDYNRAVNSRIGTNGSTGSGPNIVGAMSNVRFVKGSAVYNPSSTTITVPTSSLTAVTNTSLLTLQGTTPLVDNSGNGYGVNYTTGGGFSAPQATNFGPFAATAAPVVKGGMVWIKDRTSAYNHNLFDTVRGVTKLLHSNTTDAQVTDTTSLTSFNSNGFTIGQGTTSGSEVNAYSDNIVSWSFVKQPKFFDVVTYTGNDIAGRTVAHSLGSVPGCMIVKCTSVAARAWYVWHKSLPSGYLMTLQTTNTASSFGANFFGDGTSVVDPTASVFTLGGNTGVNQGGVSYVAYLFASNAGGFGLTGSDNVITCGSFVYDGSSSASVNLGFEPQFLLIKPSTIAVGWFLLDTMRGLPAPPGTAASEPYLYANTSAAEVGNIFATVNATGFDAANGWAGDTAIYIAIRRGPMKTPTLGTSVFSPVSRAGTSANALVTANFPVDLSLIGESTGTSYDKFLTTDRLRGTPASFETRATFAEFDATTSFQTNAFDSNVALKIGTGTGTNSSTTNYANWLFARAPGFFDEVCYTGNGSAGLVVSHNLTVTPGLSIIKRRDTASSLGWFVTTQPGGGNDVLLNTTGAGAYTALTSWASTSFTLASGYADFNASGGTYVAYLFATLAGVSKVGSYTGTGASQVINCGFTGGARFVLIKRTDTTGDWYTYDTARGMVSGTDPYLFMNSTAAQVNADYVFTSSTGFTIQTAAPVGINASGGTYIFLAIA